MSSWPSSLTDFFEYEVAYFRGNYLGIRFIKVRPVDVYPRLSCSFARGLFDAEPGQTANHGVTEDRFKSSYDFSVQLTSHCGLLLTELYSDLQALALIIFELDGITLQHTIYTPLIHTLAAHSYRKHTLRSQTF